jgi:hypothetical protein
VKAAHCPEDVACPQLHPLLSGALQLMGKYIQQHL